MRYMRREILNVIRACVGSQFSCFSVGVICSPRLRSCPFWTSLLIIGCVIRQCIVYYCIVNVRLFDDKTKVIYWLTDWLIEGSTTILLRTFRIQTFRLLLFTSVYDSYTSNFCFCKSLFSSIPTSTYTMIPFYQSRSHLHYDNTTHWISRIVAWESRLYFQLNMFYFHQSHF